MPICSPSRSSALRFRIWGQSAVGELSRSEILPLLPANWEYAEFFCRFAAMQIRQHRARPYRSRVVGEAECFIETASGDGPNAKTWTVLANENQSYRHRSASITCKGPLAAS